MSSLVPHVLLGLIGATGRKTIDLPPTRRRNLCLAPGGVTGRQDLGWEGSDLFRHPQPRRPGAGVGRHLRLRRTDGTAGDDAEGCPVAAGADWLLGWADAVF